MTLGGVDSSLKDSQPWAASRIRSGEQPILVGELPELVSERSAAHRSAHVKLLEKIVFVAPAQGQLLRANAYFGVVERIDFVHIHGV